MMFVVSLFVGMVKMLMGFALAAGVMLGISWLFWRWVASGG